MAEEIERKFLVQGDFRYAATSKTPIVQGYLSSLPERTVRVRIKGDKGFLTIKGAPNHSGISRYEWETEIPVEEAKELLSICEPGVIEKVRYLVKAGNHTFEVDEFGGENKGLVLAEVELTSEEDPFDKPTWLGEEVTGKAAFYNSRLIKHPYSRWK